MAKTKKDGAQKKAAAPKAATKVKVAKNPIDKKEKAKKAKKKKPEVKRASSSWIHFCTEHGKKLREENPDKAVGQISALCSQRWREMTEEEKKPYVDLFNKDKDRVATERAKLPQKPKGTMSAYMFFVRDWNTKNPGVTFAEKGKRMGEAWSKIDPAEKEKFQAMATEDKKRYATEMEVYKKKVSEA